jgi:hypothetical protein
VVSAWLVAAADPSAVGVHPDLGKLEREQLLGRLVLPPRHRCVASTSAVREGWRGSVMALPAERQKVRRKVKARFPSIQVSGLKGGTRKKRG